jgi:thioredoxin-like negative regulator of GroEL
VIERVLLFAIVAGGILMIGQALRWFTGKRQDAIAASMQLPPSESRDPRVLLFTGPRCSTCERQKVIIDEVTSHWPGGLCVDRIDAAEDPVAARAFGVLTVPTTVVIAPNGDIAKINGGLVRAEELERQLSAISGPAVGEMP